MIQQPKESPEEQGHLGSKDGSPPLDWTLRKEELFFVLGALFVTCLVVSDVIGGAKVVHLGRVFGYPVVLSVGMIAFPITFVITDLINEFYGAKATRFVTYVGLAMLVVTFLILSTAHVLPAAPNSPYPEEWFRKLLGSSMRLIVASLAAYLVSQLIDVAIFTFFKKLARGRYVWLRATGSTVFSQVVDTGLVQVINFYGVLTGADIWALAISSYVLKFIVAVLMTPVLYLGHGLLGHIFALEVVPPEDPRD